MTEQPDLEIVNRTLVAILRKQEEEIRELRETLLLAAGALRIAGYHDTAQKCTQTWKETTS